MTRRTEGRKLLRRAETEQEGRRIKGCTQLLLSSCREAKPSAEPAELLLGTKPWQDELPDHGVEGALDVKEEGRA